MATRDDVIRRLREAPSYVRKPAIPANLTPATYKLLLDVLDVGYATGREDERDED